MGPMTEPASTGRRDPAWRWYALAVGLLALVLVLQLTGIFDRMGP